MSIRDLIKKILDILLPQRCLSCRKISEIICDSCVSKLPKESSPYGIKTIFAYSDPVIRRVVWLIKYKGSTEIAKPLARVIHERIIEELAETSELFLNLGQKIMIIPVPLSKERERGRGFNQAEVIAREIVSYDQGKSFMLDNTVLKKTRHTKSQVEIKNRTERLKNLKGAFTLNNPKNIRGKIVVILDDVTTTGATINECARVLKRAKPRKIIKLALAH